MYVLDTDTTSLYLREHKHITARVKRQSSSGIFLSVITAEEMLNGRAAEINRLRQSKSSRITEAYIYYLVTLRQLNAFNILDYDERAEAIFQALPSAVKRVGAQDCKIAAVAQVNGFTVVTCNTQDYEKIGIVKCEDWSIE